MNHSPHVVIVGGGMVGATLALLLDSIGIRCAVIEAFELGDQQPSFDDRTIALSYGSSLLLENMGLLPYFAAGGTAIHDIEVSQRHYFGKIRMSAKDQHLQALGYVLENRRIGANLHELIAQSQIQWLAPARLTQLEVGDAGVELAYQRENQREVIHCQLVIAADGVNSKTRELLGIGASVSDYGLSAVVGNVTSQLAHKNCAYECFGKAGPLAFLPLGDYQNQPRSSVVLTLKHADVERISDMSDAQFLGLLQQQFGKRLGKLRQTSRRSYYKVALSYAEKLQVPRALVVGNAAQGLNPVAGQGFNLALRDIACVLELLAPETLKSQPDFGNAALLAPYSESRRADRRATIAFTDGLIKLFAKEHQTLAHARSMGLALTDIISPLRQKFIMRGMGLEARYRLNIKLAAYRQGAVNATL